MGKIKSKVLAAAATLTLVSGVGLAGAVTAGTASAATPSCGASCINLFPKVYSETSPTSPSFVADVFRQGERAGQPVILFRSANFDPAEDWTLAFQGTVSDFYAANLVSSAVALHYGCVAGPGDKEFPVCPSGSVNDQAYEIEYAPFGVDSGLCMATTKTAAAGTPVALEGCGQTADSVWIQDTPDSPVAPYYAAINGSDGNFSDPFVLTYPQNANPVDRPRAELVTENLDKFSNGPADNDNQLWTGVAGILP